MSLSSGEETVTRGKGFYRGLCPEGRRNIKNFEMPVRRKMIRNINILALLLFLTAATVACEKNEDGRRKKAKEGIFTRKEDKLKEEGEAFNRKMEDLQGKGEADKGVALPDKRIDYIAELGIAEPKFELPAIDFSVESLEGEWVNLFDYKGKVVFLNFWATWCGPCKDEIKDIDKLWGTLKEEDFMVLAVDLREKKKEIRSFMKENGIGFPVYIDPTGKIASMYSVGGIPTTYIIGPDGKVVGRAIGPRPWGEEVSIDFMRSLMHGNSKS